MAERFNLTAQLQLQAPTNTAQVVNQINRDLGSVTINANIQADAKSLSAVSGQLKAVEKTAKSSSASMSNLNRNIAEAARRFSVITIATGSFIGLARAIKNSVGAAVEFEREMIRISQVTGNSVSQLEGLGKEVTRLSTSLGVANQSLLETSRILAQAGLSALKTKQAMEVLANTTLAPSFDNIIDTTEGAIAILNQFGREAAKTGQDIQFLEQALDAINKVSKTFAVESKDLITAVRRTGGVFEAAGGSLNELIALFTSVRQTTRESAETIATGFRTIFTRLQRKETLEALDQLGISLSDVNGKFIGPLKAIEALANGLAGLDPKDVRFNEIVEQLGGFRQIGKVIPLIKQYAVAEQALSVANSSAGDTAKDARIAQQSLAVQFQKVREQFDALMRKFADSETFRSLAGTVLQLAEAFLKFAAALEPILPMLTTLAAIKIGRSLAPGLAGLFGGGGGGKQFGGVVSKFASGGWVPGTGNRDTVPAMLTPGEFVIKKSSARKLGEDQLSSMNRYAGGGVASHKEGKPYVSFADQTFFKKKGQTFQNSPAGRRGATKFNENDDFAYDLDVENVELHKVSPKKLEGVPAWKEYTQAAASLNDQARGLAFERVLEGLGRVKLTGGNSRIDGMVGSQVTEIKSLREGLDESNLNNKMLGAAVNPLSSVDRNVVPKLTNTQLTDQKNTVDLGSLKVLRDKTKVDLDKKAAKQLEEGGGKGAGNIKGAQLSLGRERQKMFGGIIQKFAEGGIAKAKKVGAAILDADTAQPDDTAKVTVDEINKKFPAFKNLKKGASPVSQLYKSTDFSIIRQGLSESTSKNFQQALNDGLVSGTDAATAALASDLGTGASTIDEGSKQNFIKTVRPAIRGDLFEAALLAMNNKGTFDDALDPGRPFDFPGGLKGSLKDNWSNMPSAWVDAKSSYEAAGSANMKGKIVKQIVNELKAQGVEEMETGTKKDKEARAARAAQQNEAKKRNKGGSVWGTDSVPSLLTPGEYVINKSSAQSIGYGNLNKMNQTGVARFASGGLVGVSKFADGGPVGGIDKNVASVDLSQFAREAPKAAQMMAQFTKGLADAYVGMTAYKQAIADGQTEAEALNMASSAVEKAMYKVEPEYKAAVESNKKLTAEQEKVSSTSKLLEADLKHESAALKQKAAIDQKYHALRQQGIPALAARKIAIEAQIEQDGVLLQTKQRLNAALAGRADEAAAGGGGGAGAGAGGGGGGMMNLDFGKIQSGLDKFATKVEGTGNVLSRLGSGLIGVSFMAGTLIQGMGGLSDAQKEQEQAGLAAAAAHGAVILEAGSFAIQLAAGTARILSNLAAKAQEFQATQAAAASELEEAAANVASSSTEQEEAIANTLSATSEQGETVANTASTASEYAEFGANVASSASEMSEVVANASAVTSEMGEVAANALAVSSEMTEVGANFQAAMSEMAEVGANAKAVIAEMSEVAANATAVQAEMAEVTANAAAVQAEMAEVAANSAAVEAELAEVQANALAIRTEFQEAVANVQAARTEDAESAMNAMAVKAEGEELIANQQAARLEYVEAQANSMAARLEYQEAGANQLAVQSEQAEVQANALSIQSEGTKQAANARTVQALAFLMVEAAKVNQSFMHLVVAMGATWQNMAALSTHTRTAAIESAFLAQGLGLTIPEIEALGMAAAQASSQLLTGVGGPAAIGAAPAAGAAPVAGHIAGPARMALPAPGAGSVLGGAGAGAASSAELTAFTANLTGANVALEQTTAGLLTSNTTTNTKTAADETAVATTAMRVNADESLIAATAGLDTSLIGTEISAAQAAAAQEFFATATSSTAGTAGLLGVNLDKTAISTMLAGTGMEGLSISAMAAELGMSETALASLLMANASTASATELMAAGAAADLMAVAQGGAATNAGLLGVSLGSADAAATAQVAGSTALIGANEAAAISGAQVAVSNAGVEVTNAGLIASGLGASVAQDGVMIAASGAGTALGAIGVEAAALGLGLNGALIALLANSLGVNADTLAKAINTVVTEAETAAKTKGVIATWMSTAAEKMKAATMGIMIVVMVAAIAAMIAYMKAIYQTTKAVTALKQMVSNLNDAADSMIENLKESGTGTEQEFVDARSGAAVKEFEAALIDSAKSSIAWSEAAYVGGSSLAAGLAAIAAAGMLTSWTGVGLAVAGVATALSFAVTMLYNSGDRVNKAMGEVISAQEQQARKIMAISALQAVTTWRAVKALQGFETALKDAEKAGLSAGEQLIVIGNESKGLVEEYEAGQQRMAAASTGRADLQKELESRGVLTAGGTEIEGADTTGQEENLAAYKEITKQEQEARKAQNDLLNQILAQEAQVRRKLQTAVGELVSDLSKTAPQKLNKVTNFDQLLKADKDFQDQYKKGIETVNAAIDLSFKARIEEAKKLGQTTKAATLEAQRDKQKAIADVQVRKAAMERVLAEQKARQAILRNEIVMRAQRRAIEDVNTTMEGFNNTLLGATNTAAAFAAIDPTIALAQGKGPDAATFDTDALSVPFSQIDPKILDKALEQGVSGITMGIGSNVPGGGDAVDKEIEDRANRIKKRVQTVHGLVDAIPDALGKLVTQPMPIDTAGVKAMQSKLFKDINKAVGGGLTTGGVANELGTIVQEGINELIDKGEPITMEAIQNLVGDIEGFGEEQLEAFKRSIEIQNKFLTEIDKINSAIIEAEMKVAEAFGKVADTRSRVADRQESAVQGGRVSTTATDIRAARQRRERGRRAGAQQRLGTDALAAGARAGDVNATTNALKQLQAQAKQNADAARTETDALKKAGLNDAAKRNAAAANRATKELERLANQSARAADIEKELAAERASRKQVGQVVEDFAFGSDEERVNMGQAFATTQLAINQGGIQNATSEERAQVASVLDKLSDVENVGGSGKTGAELKAQFARDEAVAQGIDPAIADALLKPSKSEQQLLKELNQLGKDEIAAANALAENAKSQVQLLEDIRDELKNNFERDINRGQRQGTQASNATQQRKQDAKVLKAYNKVTKAVEKTSKTVENLDKTLTTLQAEFAALTETLRQLNDPDSKEAKKAKEQDQDEFAASAGGQALATIKDQEQEMRFSANQEGEGFVDATMIAEERTKRRGGETISQEEGQAARDERARIMTPEGEGFTEGNMELADMGTPEIARAVAASMEGSRVAARSAIGTEEEIAASPELQKQAAALEAQFQRAVEFVTQRLTGIQEGTIESQSGVSAGSGEIASGDFAGEFADGMTMFRQGAETILKAAEANKVAEEKRKQAEKQAADTAAGKARGGLIYRAAGGSIFQPKGTDTVPAMLTPGEFVIRKSAVDRIGVGALSALNNGVAYHAQGGVVGLPEAGAAGHAFMETVAQGNKGNMIKSLQVGFGMGGADANKAWKYLVFLSKKGKLDSSKLAGYKDLDASLDILRATDALESIGAGLGATIFKPLQVNDVYPLAAGAWQPKKGPTDEARKKVQTVISRSQARRDKLNKLLTDLTNVQGTNSAGQLFAGELVFQGGFTAQNMFDQILDISTDVGAELVRERGRYASMDTQFKQAGEIDPKGKPTVAAVAAWTNLTGGGGFGPISQAANVQTAAETAKTARDKAALKEDATEGMDARERRAWEWLNTAGVLTLAKGGSVGNVLDSVPAMLTPGEFVMSPEAVKKHGVGYMRDLNRGRVPGFRRGGLVGRGVAYRANGSSGPESGGGAVLQIDPSLLQGVLDNFNALFSQNLDNIVSSFSMVSSSMDNLATALGQPITMNHNFSGDMSLAFKIENADHIKKSFAEAITPTLTKIISEEVDKKLNDMKNNP